MLIIQKNIPLASLTTLKIGGLANFFAEVKNEKELLEALNFAEVKKIKTFIFGGGSNVLFSDQGFAGLVIKMQKFSLGKQIGIKIKEEIVECWAGENLANIVKITEKNGLAGMEWAVGIPGTVGGAVRGNAGAYGGELAQNISSARVLNMENKKIIDYFQKDCQFSYRSSIFKKNSHLIILTVKFELKKSTKERVKKKMQEIIIKRNAKIPKGFSAGSFFQNPVVENLDLIHEFEKDTRKTVRDKKIPAGWLIEEAGFRGKKIGGIIVSQKHANFFINDGTGTAEDVIILAGIIKQKIRERFDVQI